MSRWRPNTTQGLPYRMPFVHALYGSASMPARDYDRILVTSALPYANGSLHSGHLAGAYPPADLYALYARYQRMKGRDVLFCHAGSADNDGPV